MHSHKVDPGPVAPGWISDLKTYATVSSGPFAVIAIRHQFITVASALAMLIVAVRLIAERRVSFALLPDPRSQILTAN